MIQLQQNKNTTSINLFNYNKQYTNDVVFRIYYNNYRGIRIIPSANTTK
jgi:hypothetical protein